MTRGGASARCGAALLLAVSVAVAAQTEPPPAAAVDGEGEAAAQDFVEVVDVQIVNIDVWVTDRQGRPVEGLAKDDFLVLRDGEPVEVTNFYTVEAGVTGSAQRTASDPVAEPGAEGGARAPMPRLETPAEHRLWIILYVDNYNLDPLERNRVLPELRSFLTRSLTDGGQAMLVTYDRSLEVRQPFTGDLSTLLARVDELEKDAGLASIRRRDRFSALQRIDDTSSFNQAMGYARQYAEEQRNGVDYTVEALEKLIETLAGLPGRKALVHVSSGVPMLAGEELFQVVAEKFGRSEPYAEIPRHDTARVFQRVNRQANAHRVAFYTLDAGGLRGFEFGAAEYGGFVSSEMRSTLDSVVPENLQAPLRLMAVETGGRAILNTNQLLPALDEVVRDFQTFYSLGIAAGDAESGRYHAVEVKLRDGNRGRSLRHRAGYRSKSMTTRVREALRSALLYGYEENPLGVGVEWGRPRSESASREVVLPIRLAIPLSGVVLFPTASGKHEARLRMFVGAVGPDGQASGIDEVPLGLRLAAEHLEAAKGESLLHTHKLMLAPGRQKVGVAVLDVFGGRTSIVSRVLEVGGGQ